MTSRRRFLKSSSSGLLGMPVLTGLFRQDDGASEISYFQNQDPFSSLRNDLLLKEGLVYLNTATLGPSPRQIVEGVYQLDQQLEQNPAILNWGELGNEMEKVRQIVANFINASKDEILITRNTTEGLSLVTTHIGLKAGDEILTTNHEHGGGYLAPEYLEKYHGVSLKKLELPLPIESKEQVIELVSQKITGKTRMLMLSHVSTVDGLVMPLQEIADIAAQREIFFLVDGAQSAGQVEINVVETGIDAYATSGHKWILGPKETGFLYLKKKHHGKFNPVFTEGGFKTYSKSSGTRNVANIIGLGRTLQLHETLGIKKISEHCRELRQYAYGQLSEIDELRLISPENEELICGIVSVELSGMDKRNVVSSLNQRNIIVKQLPDLNALRFSCHIFNTRKDIDQLCMGLEEILSG